MHCISIGFLEQLIVWVIVVGALIAIIRVAVPWAVSIVGGPIGQIINIVLWAIVAILIIYFIFGLFGCLIGAGPPFHVGHY